MINLTYLIKKNLNSLRNSLGYIMYAKKNGYKFLIKTLDCHLLSRHHKDILDTLANRIEKDTKVNNMLQLPKWKDIILNISFFDVLKIISGEITKKNTSHMY